MLLGLFLMQVCWRIARAGVVASDDGMHVARHHNRQMPKSGHHLDREPDIVDAEVIEIPGDDYRDALDRYPELNVEGAEAGDVVEIAAMIDARPEHEHRARADAGAKWLAAKAGGRLDTGPIVNETEAAERIYKSAYLLLKEADRYGDQLPDGQTLDVLEHEALRLELAHHADEVVDELVARIVHRPLADQGEALARCPAEDNIYLPLADGCAFPQLGAGQLDHGLADGRCLREVELVSGAVDGVDIDRSHHVETCLLEPKTQATDPGKEVDTDGACHTAPRV